MRKAIAIALLASLASLAAFASRGNGGAVRGAAARAGMMAAESYSARSYVQDGLIAMWDGIENAGWGTHDANASTWKDLSGNGRNWIYNSGNYTWNSDSIYLNNTIWKQNQLPKAYTIEAVVKVNSGRVLFIGYGIGTGNPGVIQSLTTIGGNTGWQVSYTYPSASSTKWPLVTVTAKHQISITYEDYNTQSTKTKDAYVNGVAASFTSGANYFANPGYSSLGNNPSWSANPIIGTLWTLRLYSRALTAAEIAHNYSVDKRRFNLP